MVSKNMLSTRLVSSLVMLSLSAVMAGCKDDSSKTASTMPSPVSTPSPAEPLPIAPTVCFNPELAKEYGITAIPTNKDIAMQNSFCKYMAIKAPNGKEIEIVAQSDISDEQLIRAHNILNFYLDNVPGTKYGKDKSAVANAMANNGARLLLLNGSDDGTNDPTIDGQPLYDSELIVEGTRAYIENDYENHRDAAFEEILHLMHDYGIGTSAEEAAPGALPAYTVEIDSARNNAMTNQLWPTRDADEGITNWIEELRLEGSLSQEYLASVIDSYYGYWGASSDDGGMMGIYSAKTRADVEAKDPKGFAVIKEYFSPVVTYLARIDSKYQDDFLLSFDINAPYTHKSQYLINAQLTGSLDSNLMGNDHDNILAGNSGTNTLDGKGGDNVALFKGEFSQYSISISDNEIQIQDSIDFRDGITTLVNIENVLFNEVWYQLEEGELLAAEEELDVKGMITADTEIVSNEHLSFKLNFKGQLQLMDGTQVDWNHERQRPYIDAANRWLNSLLSAGTKNMHEVTIDVAVSDLTQGNGAARPYVKTLTKSGDHYFPQGGEILISNFTYSDEFKSELGEAAANIEFNANILHEIGHVLGIGSLWSLSKNSHDEVIAAEYGEGNLRNWVTNSAEHNGLIYSQANGITAYNEYFNTIFDFAPVSPGHLYSNDQNENQDELRYLNHETLIPGTPEDLMANGTQITSVLLGFLKDLGWKVNNDSADRTTPTILN